MLLEHVGPGRGIGKAVGELELALQKLVNAADDAGDDRLRGIEDAAPDLLLFVVLGEEAFVEVNDWIFQEVPVIEIAKDGVEVGVRAVEEGGDFLDAELVEVDPVFAAGSGGERS